MSGSLEDVLASLYDLYMQGRIDDLNAHYFLSKLHHDNGETVFGAEDIVKMMKMLQKAKEETEEF